MLLIANSVGFAQGDKKMMRNTKIGLLALASVFSACILLLTDDISLSWTIGDSSSTSLCSTYNIYKWTFTAEGPDRVTGERLCASEEWDTSRNLYSLAEGSYRLTVNAVNSSGSVLASRDTTLSITSGYGPYSSTIPFSSSDFSGTPTGTATLKIFWNINGTQDGTATGNTWDGCTEVGATYALVTVDGEAKQYDCDNGGNQGVQLTNLTSGSHTITVKLADATGTAITTQAGDMVEATSTKAGEFVADFYYYSFLEPIKSGTSGDYLYTTTYENKSCTETSPAVIQQVVLLKLDGTPINTQSCVGATCQTTNGADFADCYASTTQQKMANLTWGAYKLKLQGALSNGTVCWETQKSASSEVEILVGAGTSNPLIAHNLDRISTGGECLP
jgi:hypothetical protein